MDQVGEGAHPEDVAAALGLHRKTVYGWLAKYREGGKDALPAQAGAGPAAEAGRAADVAALRADRRPGSAADAVRVRAVDPGDGPRGDPPRIRRPAERGFASAGCCGSSECRRSGPCTAPISRTPRRSSGGSARSTPPSGPRPRLRAPRSGSLTRPGSARTTTRAPPGRLSGRPRRCKNTGARYSVNMISVVSAQRRAAVRGLRGQHQRRDVH